MKKTDFRKKKPSPRLAVDVIIEYKGKIVLIERKNYPFGWALPGGFVEYGETVEKAARREAKEETGLVVCDLRQFHVYSQPTRDLRCHCVSVVFTAKGKGKIRAKSDAKRVGLFGKENLPFLAFDHKKILLDYFRERKKE